MNIHVPELQMNGICLLVDGVLSRVVCVMYSHLGSSSKLVFVIAFNDHADCVYPSNLDLN